MKKRKSSLLGNLFFFYSAVFALILTGTGLANGFSSNNLITTALFLPVTLFFLYELVRKFARSYRSLYHQEIDYTPNYFSFQNFFTQRGLTFTITTILLTLAISITMIRQSLLIARSGNLITYQSQSK